MPQHRPPEPAAAIAREAANPESVPKGDFPSEAPKFVLEEYKRLCAEIDLYLKESSNCVNYSIAATAAVWSWWVATPIWHHASAILFIPAILTLFWLFRWRSIQTSMGEIGRYIKKTEERIFPNQHGWETYLENRKSEGHYPMRDQGLWAGYYFGTLIVANLVIASAILWSPKTTDTPKSDALTTAINRLADALLNEKAPTAGQQGNTSDLSNPKSRSDVTPTVDPSPAPITPPSTPTPATGKGN